MQWIAYGCDTYCLQNIIELSRESNPHPQSFLFNIILIISVVFVVVAIVVVVFLVPNSSLSFGTLDQSLLKFFLLFSFPRSMPVLPSAQSFIYWDSPNYIQFKNAQ